MSDSSTPNPKDVSGDAEQKYKEYRDRFNLSSNILLGLRFLDFRNLTVSELGAIAQAKMDEVLPLLVELNAALPNCYVTQREELEEQLSCLHIPAAGKALVGDQVKDNFIHLSGPYFETFPIGQETLTHNDGDCAMDHDPQSLEKANNRLSRLRDIVQNLRDTNIRIGRTKLSLEVSSPSIEGARLTGVRRLYTNSIIQNSDRNDLPSYSWQFTESLIQPNSTQPEAGGEEQSTLVALSYEQGLEEPVKNWVLRSGMDRDHLEHIISQLNLPPEHSIAGSDSDHALAERYSLSAVLTELLTSMDPLSREQSVSSADSRSSSSHGARSTRTEMPCRPNRDPSSVTPSSSSKRPANDEEGEELPLKRRR